MTDRELLEAAAKVAGFDALARMYGWDDIGGGVLLDANDPPETWNPLTDDGDAFRLAVKLEIDICFGANYVIADSVQQPTLNNANDPCAAVRYAIVRAAGELAA